MNISLERTRNFSSFHFTRFCGGELVYLKWKVFTWSLNKVLTKLCLYIPSFSPLISDIGLVQLNSPHPSEDFCAMSFMIPHQVEVLVRVKPLLDRGHLTKGKPTVQVTWYKHINLKHFDFNFDFVSFWFWETFIVNSLGPVAPFKNRHKMQWNNNTNNRKCNKKLWLAHTTGKVFKHIVNLLEAN